EGPAPSGQPLEERELFEAVGLVGESGRPEGEPGGGDPKEKYPLLEKYRAAAHAAAERDWEGAIERFRAMLREEPWMVDAWRRLGITASRSDRHDIAVDAFRHVLQLAPDDVSDQLRTGFALHRLRRLDEARVLALRAIAHPQADSASLSAAHE